MAIAAVQRIGKGGDAVTSLAIGSGDGWVTPTAGNLLVASANSDNTVTMTTSGFTAGPSVVDGNGAYTWYKVAAGTESTITITPGAASNTAMTVAEYSGATATPFDAQNSSTIAGTAGTTTTSASVTSTAAADLVVAFALVHSFPGANPSAPSWTNSFVNRLSPTGGSVGARVTTFASELLPAGAAGSYSTVCTWTASANDRQFIILAFKASAGSAAPAFPPSQQVRRRLAVAPRGRARTATPVREQVNPPFPFTGVKQPRRLRGLLPRRAESFMPTPPQAAVVAPTFPPQAVRTRLKGLRLFRGHATAPVPAQAAVAAPAYPPRPVRARLAALRLARGRVTAAPAGQPTPAGQQRLRLRPPRILRGHTAGPVPAQAVVAAPPYPPQSVRTRLRGLRIFRGRAAAVVPPQIVVTPPAYPPANARIRVRGLRLFRGRASAPVPAQTVVVPPSFVPPSVRARLKWLRWGRARLVTPAADQVAAPPAPRSRPRGMAPRRGHAAMPVPPQVSVTPPAYPPRPVRSRLKGLRPFRGREAAMPVPPQVVIVPPKQVPLFARIKQHAVRIFRGGTRTPVMPVCDCTTHRPDLGTTGRPSSGITARPGAGTTARPAMGMTARPDDGTTTRPCSCND